VFFTTIKAGWLLGFWFIFQLLSGLSVNPAEGGVAFWAHVGGFVAGVALIWFLRDRNYRPRAGRTRLPGRSRIPETSRRVAATSAACRGSPARAARARASGV